MEVKSTSTSFGGIGFCGLLGICFIVLKLMGIITWSWVWVLAPIWIPFAIFAFILLSILSFSYIAIKKEDDAERKLNE